MSGDNRRPKNLVSTCLDEKLEESFFFSVGDRSVDIAQRNDKCVYLDSSLLAVPLIHSDMSNLRISVCTPRNSQRTEFLSSQKESILNHDARGCICCVCKFVGQANITCRID